MDALNNYLIIKQDEVANVTPSGLIMPPYGNNASDGVVGAPYTGVVMSVGSEVCGEWKVGDKVAFSDMCNPYIMEDDSGAVLVMTEDNIVAKLIE